MRTTGLCMLKFLYTCKPSVSFDKSLLLKLTIKGSDQYAKEKMTISISYLILQTKKISNYLDKFKTELLEYLN